MTLILLPNLLGEKADIENNLPSKIAEEMQTIDGLIAESEKGARRYLKRFQLKKPPHQIPVALYNKHTSKKDFDFLLEPIEKGERWGLLSDAGLPCVADPGADLIWHARKKKIQVIAYPGPSSIFLALMLSGLPGQSFSFHGYLNKEPKRRIEQIINLQKLSKQYHATQICIEAPHRNEHLLKNLIEYLHPKARLCVALDLTLPTQKVVCHLVEKWRKKTFPELKKSPAIFLFHLNPFSAT